MSVLPVAPRPLTVAEYLAFGEPESGYTELVEGAGGGVAERITAAQPLLLRGGRPTPRAGAAAPRGPHLVGSFGYADSGEITGVFEAAEPFPIRLELDALL
jgi:hypothetical protein